MRLLLIFRNLKLGIKKKSLPLFKLETTSLLVHTFVYVLLTVKMQATISPLF